MNNISNTNNSNVKTNNIEKTKPSKKLQEALQEAEKIANDPNYKGYNNIDELMKSLLDDE